MVMPLTGAQGLHSGVLPGLIPMPCEPILFVALLPNVEERPGNSKEATGPVKGLKLRSDKRNLRALDSADARRLASILAHLDLGGLLC